MSWFGSRGGLKFTKSSERPKVRLENRKSAELENRLNLKSGDEEVKGNTEEEGNSSFSRIKNVLTKVVLYDRVSVIPYRRASAWNLKAGEHPQQASCSKQKQSQCSVGGGSCWSKSHWYFITIFEWAGEKQRQRQQLARLLRFIFCLTPPGGVQYCVCFSLHCSRATIQSRG